MADEIKLSAQLPGKVETVQNTVSLAKKPSVYELVQDHVDTEHKDEPTVAEHLAELDAHEVEQPDPHTGGARRVLHWQAAALIARFRLQGLKLETRIPADVFKAAYDEAIHGRV